MTTMKLEPTAAIVWRRRRDRTVVGRAMPAVRALARWLPGARTALLTVSGLGCLVAAAWLIAVPLGLVALGVGLLTLEYLSADDRGSGIEPDDRHGVRYPDTTGGIRP